MANDSRARVPSSLFSFPSESDSRSRPSRAEPSLSFSRDHRQGINTIASGATPPKRIRLANRPPRFFPSRDLAFDRGRIGETDSQDRDRRLANFQRTGFRSDRASESAWTLARCAATRADRNNERSRRRRRAECTYLTHSHPSSRARARARARACIGARACEV